MRAKACARCRQSKLRCDSDVTTPRPCTRCRHAGTACVVDLSYQRVNKNKRLIDLEAEVSDLRRKAAQAQAPDPVAARDKSAGAIDSHTPDSHPAPQQALPASPATTTSPSTSIPNGNSNSSNPGTRVLCGVSWSPAQAVESFRIFFIQYHPYLELPLSVDPENTFERCPLLFWVICAVTSSPAIMVKLQPSITDMVSTVTTRPARSIEVIHALLILCVWPFPFDTTLEDPSFIYCGIATRIGYQIGLHRPGLQTEYSSRQEVLSVDEHARRLTWVACYVVNQMQCARLGVPSCLQVDYTLDQTVESPHVPLTLASLYRIARITSQFSDIIGSRAQNATGLQDQAVRMDMVRHFGSELDMLRRSHLQGITEPVETAYLTAKLHLRSYILHDDMPLSPELLELYHHAEKDAADLILLSSGKNLSRCPWHIARAVLFAGLVLVRILTSSYTGQSSTIADRIALASQTLQTAVKQENDHAQRWTRHLISLMSIQDRKQTEPIRSRMTASLLYDTIRVMKEHVAGLPTGQQRLTREDPDRLPEMSPLQASDDLMMELDTIDWDNIVHLL